MAVHRLRWVLALLVASLFFCSYGRNQSLAGDGPNRISQSDFAVGSFVDSLFEPELRRKSPSKKRSHSLRPRVARRRTGWHAKLVNNPHTNDGSPPFALVDRYGGILRYIEPVEGVDLDSQLGAMVTVRHDTGDILLASQLAFNRTPPDTGNLQLAAFAEPTLADAPAPIPAGESVGESIVGESVVGEPIFMPEEQGPVYLDEGYDAGYDENYEKSYQKSYDEGINFGDCPSCGRSLSQCRGDGCGYGARGVMYAHGEYLLWWLEGMNTPELVTQVQADVTTDPRNPVLIGPAQTLYGGNRVLKDSRNGGRITLGLWLDDYGQWGIEGDYLGLGEINERFTAGAIDLNSPQNGQYIFRPFFNTADFTRDDNTMVPRGNALEDVDTNRLDGSVTVDVRSQFQSAGIRLRHSLSCRAGSGTSCGDGVACGGGVGCGNGVSCPLGPLNRLCNLLGKGTRRSDVLYGLRWASLDESLQANENLRGIDITSPTVTLGNKIDVQDRFATENTFVGGEVGYETEWAHRRWSLNFLSKVAIGSTRQRVAISGFTDIDNNPNDVTPPVRTQGGLLTQSFVIDGADNTLGTADDKVIGNIGTYRRDEFSMIPEIGLTLGFKLTQRIKLTAGYTLLYWSNVVRPGDQIDLDVNGNLLRRSPVLPPSTTLIVQDDHPRFNYRQTDLWAQGINFGAEYTW